MSDPLLVIIDYYETAGYSTNPKKWIDKESLAKQIRQEIGRELLEALKEVSNQVDITSAYGEGNCDGIGIDAAEIVEKICQLGGRQ